MPSRHSSHSITLRPDYCTLQLRDIDCDAGVGAHEALDEARRNVAASSGYGIYINARQDSVAVRVDVEVWDSTPDPVDADGWTGPLAFDLDCPTGQLQVGDNMGNTIAGIDPPQGPGRCTVTVYHQGRDQAADAERTILHVMGSQGAGVEQIEALQARYAGAERYLLQLWWRSDLPPDDDDD